LLKAVKHIKRGSAPDAGYQEHSLFSIPFFPQPVRIFRGLSETAAFYLYLRQLSRIFRGWSVTAAGSYLPRLVHNCGDIMASGRSVDNKY
jgi:hypothetical protein